MFVCIQTCWGWWQPLHHRDNWSKPPCCNRAQLGRAAGWLLCRHRKNSPPRSQRSLWVGHWWREWETMTRTRMRRNSGPSCVPPAGGGVLESDLRTQPGQPKRLIKKINKLEKKRWATFQSVTKFPKSFKFDVQKIASRNSVRTPYFASPLTNYSAIEVIRQHPLTDCH